MPGLVCVLEGKRLWLDDIRQPPWGYDLWAKNYNECIQMLEAHHIVHASLDHDLSTEHYGSASSDAAIDRSKYKEKTGYDVLEWMHEFTRWVPEIHVHTLNPRGGADMISKLRNRAPEWVSYKRVWPKGEV